LPDFGTGWRSRTLVRQGRLLDRWPAILARHRQECSHDGCRRAVERRFEAEPAVCAPPLHTRLERRRSEAQPDQAGETICPSERGFRVVLALLECEASPPPHR